MRWRLWWRVGKSDGFGSADSGDADGIRALVTVDISKLSSKTKRDNITLTERVLALMDKYASEHSETRSGLIA